MGFNESGITADEYKALSEYINTSVSVTPEWEIKPKGGENKIQHIAPIKVEITLSKIDYLEKTIEKIKELKHQHPDITVIIRVQKH